MGNVNLLLQIPFSDYMSMYLIAIMFVAFIGIAMSEWLDKRSGRIINRICDRVAARRALVVKRNSKQ